MGSALVLRGLLVQFPAHRDTLFSYYRITFSVGIMRIFLPSATDQRHVLKNRRLVSRSFIEKQDHSLRLYSRHFGTFFLDPFTSRDLEITSIYHVVVVSQPNSRWSRNRALRRSRLTSLLSRCKIAIKFPR